MITAVRIPGSLASAAEYAAAGGWIMAGGTVVMAQVNNGSVDASELISLRAAGLSGIRVADDMVHIGATTTFREVAELEFLADAVRTIASPSIRNLATVGGNLFVPQPYGDFAVCLLALDATVHIAGSGENRAAKVGEPLARGEIVTGVSFARPAAGTWFYRKAMRRKLNSAAIVAVAAVVHTEGGVVSSARIALGGVAPRPVRAVSAERVLVGRWLDAAALDEAGAAARADIEPFDDAYASAWYRTRVLPVHLRRAVLR
ncbi:xanthine dehydrogenase family protein subunit M [Actinoplanes sp. TBRC 11911]|uniref:FAD binding domain-containing protein n=1 Tax=Actinoplanes sp. TBRC 11911 TaxID=2729386 RepID=UPI00145D998F|nr:FAD binding domain-containing protein [Actinoplanes sp. TBRC 11911]NMO53795.1 xanthine dehydrogenase family protein subunit M [Actinoplanes sp. TBRC 11911]